MPAVLPDMCRARRTVTIRAIRGRAGWDSISDLNHEPARSFALDIRQSKRLVRAVSLGALRAPSPLMRLTRNEYEIQVSSRITDYGDARKTVGTHDEAV